MPELEKLIPDAGLEEHRTPLKIKLNFYKEESREIPLQRVDFFAATPSCLSDWFIQRLTRPGDQVCDVFAGRGTTAISAYLLDRDAITNDLNPLSEIMIKGRIAAPSEAQLRTVLKQALATPAQPMSEQEARIFPLYFSPQVLGQLWAIRSYLLQTMVDPEEREAWECLRFLLADRLLGNGTESLSVSLPGIGRMTRPEAQAKRNLRLGPHQEANKEVEAILLRRFKHYQQAKIKSMANIICLNQDATDLSSVMDQSVQLHFTVPPEMNTRAYLEEHWLRLLFFGYREEELTEKFSPLYTPEEWQKLMTRVMSEQKRTLKQGGRSVWVLADSKHVSEVLWPRLLQAGDEIGWQPEIEYHCQIPSTKIKKRLQGNIAVRIMQFLYK